jgi:hypothetical protein
MKNIFIIILSCTFSQSFSQLPTKNQKLLEMKIFNDLSNIKCEGNSAIHSYLNGLSFFVMDKKYDNGLFFYKMNQQFRTSLSVGVYESTVGYRIVYDNNYVYKALSNKGTFIETHKEGSTFFLVYSFEGENYLLNSYTYKGNTFYSIDSYCLD